MLNRGAQQSALHIPRTDRPTPGLEKFAISTTRIVWTSWFWRRQSQSAPVKRRQTRAITHGPARGKPRKRAAPPQTTERTCKRQHGLQSAPQGQCRRPPGSASCEAKRPRPRLSCPLPTHHIIQHPASQYLPRSLIEPTPLIYDTQECLRQQGGKLTRESGSLAWAAWWEKSPSTITSLSWNASIRPLKRLQIVRHLRPLGTARPRTAHQAAACRNAGISTSKQTRLRIEDACAISPCNIRIGDRQLQSSVRTQGGAPRSYAQRCFSRTGHHAVKTRSRQPSVLDCAFVDAPPKRETPKVRKRSVQPDRSHPQRARTSRQALYFPS